MSKHPAMRIEVEEDTLVSNRVHVYFDDTKVAFLQNVKLEWGMQGLPALEFTYPDPKDLEANSHMQKAVEKAIWRHHPLGSKIFVQTFSGERKFFRGGFEAAAAQE